VLEQIGEPEAAAPTVVDPRVTEQLRALGYVE
jgi:hypothetical protein